MNDERDIDNKPTILVVDDTPASVGMIQAALEQENYQVLIATSGEKALERINFIEPDLILLDIMMPGIDGYETCLQLKSNEKTRDIPIIFLSALSDTFDKVKAFSIGAVDYLTKPVEPEELLIRVRNHIRLNQLEQELILANRELDDRVNQKSSALIHANAMLSEKEELLRIVYNLSPIGIGLIDLDGRINDLNLALGQFFGFSGPSDYASYSFFLDSNFSNQIISRIKNSETLEIEGLYDIDRIKRKNLYRTKKGGSVYYQMKIIPCYNSKTDQSSGYILFLQDITEWKQKERIMRDKANE
ncbi:response regulator [Methanospirillum lacunae]|nr:response regulator [Methanospirillum lacunae]